MPALQIGLACGQLEKRIRRSRGKRNKTVFRREGTKWRFNAEAATKPTK